MKFRFEQNQNYQATATLKGLAVITPNSVIKEQLEKKGFVNVSVDGSGKERRAIGKWSKIDGEEEFSIPGVTVTVQII